MSDVTIVKKHQVALTDIERAALNRVLHDSMRGLSPDDGKRWKRFWRRMMKAEPGEVFSLSMVIPRDPVKHRKFFALLTLGFEHWGAKRVHKTYRGMAVEKNFETFRKDITKLAGYFEQHWDLEGRMQVVAKSISFGSMEDPEFNELYDAVANVLLERVLTNYAGRAELDAVVDKIMKFTEDA
jgi:hypothetical protein